MANRIMLNETSPYPIALVNNAYIKNININTAVPIRLLISAILSIPKNTIFPSLISSTLTNIKHNTISKILFKDIDLFFMS